MHICVYVSHSIINLHESSNLVDSFVSLLVEPIARKNVSPNKILWRFLKNVLVEQKL